MNEYAKFAPRGYLEEFYSTAGMASDEVAIAEFVRGFLVSRGKKFAKMLDFGSGPTIHHVALFAPHVERVYIADFLKSNLKEINDWIEKRGHDWTPYIRDILAREGKASDAAIAGRMRMLRSKIKGLHHCNALNAAPFGDAVEAPFPLVTSFYCLECIGHEKARWKLAMRNMTSLVAPGGWVVMSALRDTDKYIVGGQEFPATRINEHDMRKTLVACGFVPETINIQVHPCVEWEAEGFSSVIVCSARKKCEGS